MCIKGLFPVSVDSCVERDCVQGVMWLICLNLLKMTTLRLMNVKLYWDVLTFFVCVSTSLCIKIQNGEKMLLVFLIPLKKWGMENQSHKCTKCKKKNNKTLIIEQRWIYLQGNKRWFILKSWIYALVKMVNALIWLWHSDEGRWSWL